ncbi:MAG: hypothetical protein ACOCRK_01315 [bacterium]
MIYREKGEWKLCPKKVKYERKDGEIIEEYTNKPEWYQNFAKKWEGFEVLEINDTEFSQEEKDRLEKVKNMSEGHREAVKEYIETGEFPEGMDLSELLRTGEISKNIIPSELVGEEEIEE